MRPVNLVLNIEVNMYLITMVIFNAHRNALPPNKICKQYFSRIEGDGIRY